MQSLPKGAMGSRSQSELIELHEMVKDGEINVGEAHMLFNAWNHRYGKNNATSFKDKQVSWIQPFQFQGQVCALAPYSLSFSCISGWHYRSQESKYPLCHGGSG